MDKNLKSINDIIDRYVYDVAKRLSPSQCADIEKELRSLIDDMLADRIGQQKPTIEDIETVLIELGRPIELAARYKDEKRYLIGPVYYDIYMLVLKIVLIAVTGGLALSMVIGTIVTPPQNVWKTIGMFFASEFSALVQAFAWVTFVFVLIERFADKDMVKKEWKWKPSDLPPVPNEKATIKISEPIFGIIFGVIALIIVNVAPEIIAVYSFGGVHTSIPVFNIDVWRGLLPLIDLIIGLGIAKEISKLIAGQYTLRLAAVITLINIIAMIMLAYVFLNPQIWNPDFCTSMHDIGFISSASNCERIFSQVPKYFVGLMVFGHVIGTIVTLVKGTRHRNTAA